tara:strand:- start:1396 stop:2037 length:642 start_codon:yes stop_codon:yes gene_type:complete
MVGTIQPTTSFSSNGQVANQPSLNIHQSSNISGSASVTSIGEVHKLAQADLSTLGGFTQGFTTGFRAGSYLSAFGTIEQQHIGASSSLTAHAENITHHQASLHASATLITEVCRFEGRGSLTANGVLLHGGAVNLQPIATITMLLSSDTENPDIVDIVGYINRSDSFTFYIDKQIAITSYIDKELSLSAYIDKTKDSSVYIDKIINKTLVRER